MWKLIDTALPVTFLALVLLVALSNVDNQRLFTIGWSLLVGFLAGRGYQMVRHSVASKITQ